MPTALVIAGAALQLGGLLLVFVELSMIRSHELGEPLPWSRLRAKLALAQTRRGTRPLVSDSTADRGSNGQVPAWLSPMSIDDRLQWGSSVRMATQLAIRDSQRVATAAHNQAQTIRAEIASRDAERRSRLIPTLRIQRFGAVLVLVGPWWAQPAPSYSDLETPSQRPNVPD